ncbi:MAG: SF1B family DNA helicase RecD2 [Egibacteraceae bacterium]
MEEELVGEVAAVVFTNEATGFGVVQLEGDGARASGPLASLVAGQSVRLVGRWTEHERYGPTFEAVWFEQAEPRSSAGLIAFLASGRFPGVGKTKAKRLVKAFGLELGMVITKEPERLCEVKGISPQAAEQIVEAWRRAGALGELVAVFAPVGLGSAAAQAAYRRFGDDALRLVTQDPYALLEVRGVAWTHVEALGQRAGVDPLDPRRLRAGAVTAHREHCRRGGHVLSETAELLAEAGRLLGVPPDRAEQALTLAETDRMLVRDTEPLDEAPPERWYARGDLAAEEGLAKVLARLCAAQSRVRPVAAEHECDPALTPEQVAGVRAALSSAVSVLTGGPGTGKTRTVVEIVRACRAHDLEIALCAPTGRAARRMEEVTGAGASTIHRLLEARPAGEERSGGSGFVFGYDELRRLPHDVVVADEWSMADVRLAWALAQAVSDGAHLVLVGDADQLPSVGPGAVLRDLLSSPAVPATRLTTIHRQAAASRIVTLAHEVNAGQAARVRGCEGDVFAVPEHPLGVAGRVAEIVATRAPSHFDLASSDVQVLAPMYRGPGGVDRLNERIKERLNPAAGRRAVAGFHEGDRVVQTRNDAELDVANGDIGEVIATDATARTLQVAFPHGVITYNGEQAADLTAAWCLTVHKSQGGEWPVVVLVLDPAHRAMLWRELVYTGITRASRALLLVGDPGLVVEAARRTGSGLRQRRTLLTARLARAVASNTGNQGEAQLAGR